MSGAKKKIGKPSRILYSAGFGILRAYFRIFQGTKFTIDRSGL